MRELINALHAGGLVVFRPHVQAFAGFFTVLKKDQFHQRLIIDARVASWSHRKPPYSPLSTPGAVSEIRLPHHHVPDGDEVFGASFDLQDGFCQFRWEAMCEWFGLDHRVRAEQFGVLEVFDSALGVTRPTRDGEWLWPCFCGLPMGWAWALYFCHNALTRGLVAAFRIFNPALSQARAEALVVKDRQPAPTLHAEGRASVGSVRRQRQHHRR